MNINFSSKKRDESGLVSIIVVTIIIILLSLVTVSFTRIMDREYRHSLDRELATQAHYAAEAGMNDARVFVSQAIKEGKDPSTAPGQCLNPVSPPGGVSTNPFVDRGSISGRYSDVENDNLVRYSCVIIDTKPKELVYGLKKGESKILKVVPSEPLSSIFVSWESNAYTDDPQPLTGSPYQLPKETAIGDDNTGALRATLYPIKNNFTGNADSVVRNDQVADASRNYIFYPNGSASEGNPGTANYTAGTQGFVNGNCNVANRNDAFLPNKQAPKLYCNSRITNLGPAPAPAPSPPNRVNIQGRIEGRTDYPDIRLRIIAREGGKEQTLVNRIYDPGSFITQRRAACDVTINNSQQRSVNFNDNVDLDSSYNFTNPEIIVEFTGDAWQEGEGDNNIIVERVRFVGSGYNAELNQSSYTDFAGTPVWALNGEMCTDGRATWNAPPPPIPPADPVAVFYYIKLTALYKDLNVSIQASNSANQSVQLTKAQAVIDVTGEGNDILKRLRGRVCLTDCFDTPNVAIQSMDTLCKRLRLLKTGPGAADFGAAIIDDPNRADAAPTGPRIASECQPNP